MTDPRGILVYSTPLIVGVGFLAALAIDGAIPSEEDCFDRLMADLGSEENYTIEQLEASITLRAVRIDPDRNVCDLTLRGHPSFPRVEWK